MSRRGSDPSVVVAYIVVGLFAALGAVLFVVVLASGARA
jgi:hypothetical protein